MIKNDTTLLAFGDIVVNVDAISHIVFCSGYCEIYIRNVSADFIIEDGQTRPIAEAMALRVSGENALKVEQFFKATINSHRVF